MEVTEYMLDCYLKMVNTSNLALKKRYYMEFTATLKLLTATEISELRRKIFKYKGWF